MLWLLLFQIRFHLITYINLYERSNHKENQLLPFNFLEHKKSYSFLLSLLSTLNNEDYNSKQFAVLYENTEKMHQQFQNTPKISINMNNIQPAIFQNIFLCYVHYRNNIMQLNNKEIQVNIVGNCIGRREMQWQRWA